jgi:hypothetical protein
MNRKEIESTIAVLKSNLTGNMIQDMNIKDEIHSLEMKLNRVKPEDSHFECEGCGS